MYLDYTFTDNQFQNCSQIWLLCFFKVNTSIQHNGWYKLLYWCDNKYIRYKNNWSQIDNPKVKKSEVTESFLNWDTIDGGIHLGHLRSLPSISANERSPGHPAVTSDPRHYN